MQMRKSAGKSPNGQQRTDSTGVSPQLTVCQSRPHCLRRIGYRSDCDWTGYPIFGVSIGSLTTFHRYLLVGRSWRTAPHAYAHHNHKEEVFGEWLFGCQGTILFTPHKGKQGGGFRPLTLSPMGNYEFPLIIKIFFWFFLSACPYACKPPFVKYQRECSLKLF